MEITNLDKNPGILPFNLGTARVKIASHTFLHYFDLIPVSNQINTLKQQYNDVTKAIEQGLSSPYFYALQNFNQGILFQLELVENKFNSIYPFIDDTRVKRGLINGLGSIVKAISGNLDQEDAEKYNRAIEHLQSKQQQVISQINKEISLTTKILDNYNKTISLVLHNQDVITRGIEKIEKDFNKFIFDFSHYMQTRDVLDQISITLNMLLHLLTNIENAVSFAKLGTLHHSILKSDELEAIVEKLLEFHSDSQLLYFNRNNLYKYYDIVQVKAFVSNKRLIFALEFPLVHPNQFSHYHLYSIPTASSTTIIPENTYLTMSSDSYQYQSTPCRKLDPGYLCEESYLIDGLRQEDCVFSLLQLSSSNATCPQVPIHVNAHLIEEISDAYYIAIIPKPLKIQIHCEKMDFTTLCGNYLITLPPSCSFSTTQYEYINEKGTMEGQPLLLPEIKISKTQTNISSTKLDIKVVPLDQLHTLQREQERVKPIDLDDISYSPGVETIPLYVIFAVIVAAFIAYKIWKRNTLKTARKPEVKKTQNEKTKEETEVKVLFVPDKTSL